MHPDSQNDQYKRKISKEDINALPIISYGGEIHLVRTEQELQAALEDLGRERVLGFDTETKPSFRKGKLNAPSLVQLAGSHCVYLVQLTWLPLGESLASLLSNANILKAGVSIHDDLRELQKMHPFTPAGIIDLGNEARANNLETQGLRNLAANFFNYRITKGPQCSNWSVHELSRKQISYAATDAWVGREVFLRMEELGMIRL